MSIASLLHNSGPQRCTVAMDRGRWRELQAAVGTVCARHVLYGGKVYPAGSLLLAGVQARRLCGVYVRLEWEAVVPPPLLEGKAVVLPCGAVAVPVYARHQWPRWLAHPWVHRARGRDDDGDE